MCSAGHVLLPPSPTAWGCGAPRGLPCAWRRDMGCPAVAPVAAWGCGVPRGRPCGRVGISDAAPFPPCHLFLPRDVRPFQRCRALRGRVRRQRPARQVLVAGRRTAFKLITFHEKNNEPRERGPGTAAFGERARKAMWGQPAQQGLLLRVPCQGAPRGASGRGIHGGGGVEVILACRGCSPGGLDPRQSCLSLVRDTGQTWDSQAGSQEAGRASQPGGRPKRATAVGVRRGVRIPCPQRILQAEQVKTRNICPLRLRPGVPHQAVTRPRSLWGEGRALPASPSSWALQGSWAVAAALHPLPSWPHGRLSACVSLPSLKRTLVIVFGPPR